jgi:hypothetical protein
VLGLTTSSLARLCRARFFPKLQEAALDHRFCEQQASR